MTPITPVLSKLLSNLSSQEQRELERFATYLLLRRQIAVEQIVSDDISPSELAQWTMHGGGFDWLADEPDLYSEADGEKVVWPQRS